jgi:hypothetical protein
VVANTRFFLIIQISIVLYLHILMLKIYQLVFIQELFVFLPELL